MGTLITKRCCCGPVDDCTECCRRTYLNSGPLECCPTIRLSANDELTGFVWSTRREYYSWNGRYYLQEVTELEIVQAGPAPLLNPFGSGDCHFNVPCRAQKAVRWFRDEPDGPLEKTCEVLNDNDIIAEIINAAPRRCQDKPNRMSWFWNAPRPFWNLNTTGLCLIDHRLLWGVTQQEERDDWNPCVSGTQIDLQCGGFSVDRTFEFFRDPLPPRDEPTRVTEHLSFSIVSAGVPCVTGCTRCP